MSNWYVKRQNEQYGPFEKGGLIALYHKGEFSKESLVWVYSNGGWDWVKAEDVIELSDIFVSNKDIPIEGIAVLPEKLAEKLAENTLLAATSLLDNKIWAVAGGKGGVGKSIISASLAIGLTILGKRVILIDLDLGGANLSTIFGVPEPSKTLYDFLTGNAASLQSLIAKTNIDRLFLISGRSGALGGANILHVYKKKLISHLKDLDCDYVILDIGAGSSYNQLDFFIEADQGIVVTMPEPHAIQDGYHFVKTALLRKISHQFKDEPAVSTYFKDKKHVRMEKIDSLYQEIPDKDLIYKIQGIVSQFTPRIILNQVMNRTEIKDGHFLIKTLKLMLQVNADYLGYVYFDAHVRRATQNLKPFLIEYPKSEAATCIFSIIVHKLLNQSGFRAKFEEMGLRKKVKGIEYETTYRGYRSGIGIYK